MIELTPENTVIDGHRIAFDVQGEGPPVTLIRGTSSFVQHQVAHRNSRRTREIADCAWELRGKPAQIIGGDSDGWQIIDRADKLRESLLDPELHVLPDCGHFAMQDRPHDVANLIADFIARHEHGAG